MRWMMTLPALAVLLAAAAASAEPAPERPVAVDGDSIVVGGVEWRLVGFDTPEIGRAWCEAELRLGRLARQRLQAMIDAAGTVETVDSGERDRHRRPLGDLILDGANVREAMIAEGYARPYNGGRRKGWCSRDSRDDLVPGLPPTAGKPD
jgi:endonuclease YncB( thermonuclease family)